MVTLDMDVSIN